ncbi:MAG: hypothetical protein WD075_07170 [Rhodospirillales bacterium]
MDDFKEKMQRAKELNVSAQREWQKALQSFADLQREMQKAMTLFAEIQNKIKAIEFSAFQAPQFETEIQQILKSQAHFKQSIENLGAGSLAVIASRKAMISSSTAARPSRPSAATCPSPAADLLPPSSS